VRTIKELQELIIDSRDKRNWKQFHNPKDIAISLLLEASELLENFQWKSRGEAVEKNYEDMKDELADVFIYTLLLTNELNIDLEQAVKDKIKKNMIKYPEDKAYGSNKKYTKLE
jgi:NTP pyrophosphatase (non-canonical NTP hydrolase)